MIGRTYKDRVILREKRRMKKEETERRNILSSIVEIPGEEERVDEEGVIHVGVDQKRVEEGKRNKLNREVWERALEGRGATVEQALRIFADQGNWYTVNGERGEDGPRGGLAGDPYCHWAWKGLVRPPYELAQGALREEKRGREVGKNEGLDSGDEGKNVEELAKLGYKLQEELDEERKIVKEIEEGLKEVMERILPYIRENKKILEEIEFLIRLHKRGGEEKGK